MNLTPLDETDLKKMEIFSNWSDVDDLVSDEFEVVEIEKRTEKRMGFRSLWTKQKDKLIGSAYNFYKENMKSVREYGDEPIWVLGEVFEMSEEGEVVENGEYFHILRCKESVKNSFIFSSYRRDFPMIDVYSCSTDFGWGCMVRTGQMMAAKAILIVCFGRGWEYEDNRDTKYLEILSWFYDRPFDSLFSIHDIVNHNIELNGYNENDLSSGGEWFSPSKISRCLKTIFCTAKPYGITLYSATDGVVYLDEIIELCTPQPNEEILDVNPNDWSPFIVLITTRLGIEMINPVYIPYLKILLESLNCLGFIGGKPKSSLYFIGYQGNDILYLDPHFVQSTVHNDPSDDDITSYSAKSLLKMPFTDMDPCLTAGLLFQSKEEFFDFLAWHNTLELSNQTFFTFEPNRSSNEYM